MKRTSDEASRALRAMHRVTRRLDELASRLSFKKIHGPRRVSLAPTDVALVLVGRNNAKFLRENINHHRSLGASHVVYIDNGSTDDSLEVACSHDRVTVYSTSLNFRGYQKVIRDFAVSRVTGSGWILAVDCDELFDYPGAPGLSLPALVARLDARGYSAVVAQMLDLVPEGFLDGYAHQDLSEAVSSFTRYSLDDLRFETYHDPTGKLSYFLAQNACEDDHVRIVFGGLRNTVFGEDCCLTKHPLFRVANGVRAFAHPHVSTGLTCADFTALLKHYKFACGVKEREQQLVIENRMENGEIEGRVRSFEENGDQDLSLFASHRFDGVERLIAEGFLYVSPDARQMLEWKGND